VWRIAALDGLQPVVDVRDGAVEDDVAGVVEEPVPVAALKRRLGALLRPGILVSFGMAVGALGLDDVLLDPEVDR
jgi:hypothetical protein